MLENEKEFFYEATVRICGNLEVETFLFDSYNYIKNFVPIDDIVLSYFNAESQTHNILAIATDEGCKIVNKAVSPAANIRSFLQRTDLEPVLSERAELHPTALPWIEKGFLDKDSSLIVIRLIVKEKFVGGITFIAKESNKFSKAHADLLSLLRKPFSIALSNSLRYQQLLKLKNLLAEDNRFLQGELRQAAGDEIVGANFGLKSVMEMAKQVAPLTSPVLLLGETGTGKEVIANAIHQLSNRKNNPFIKINCGAIPENLVDSELFGHEKGAFTGALSVKRGRFERAEGGTIFLDEFGELTADAQVRLLRVLQENELERVGGTEPIKIDVRVIAATNRDLSKMIKEGTFREDLYFRLNVFPITMPPLRFRTSDIPSLVYYFMNKKSHEIGLKKAPSLAPDTLESLTRYSWPGNVRELENLVERALILNKGEPLLFQDLPVSSEADGKTKQEVYEDLKVDSVKDDFPVLDKVIMQHIEDALKITAGKVGGENGAAQLLDVNPSTLRKRMRKLGILYGRNAVK